MKDCQTRLNLYYIVLSNFFCCSYLSCFQSSFYITNKVDTWLTDPKRHCKNRIRNSVCFMNTHCMCESVEDFLCNNNCRILTYSQERSKITFSPEFIVKVRKIEAKRMKNERISSSFFCRKQFCDLIREKQFMQNAKLITQMQTTAE